MKKTREILRLASVLLSMSAFGGAWPQLARAEEPTLAPADAQVARAVFARAIVEREPQDVVSGLDAGAEQIFFFTELIGMQGQTVRHRWELGGQVMAEIEFKVGAQRWRVHSSKRFIPGQVGVWTVSVVDETGRVLRSETLGRALAGSPPASPSVPAAPAEE